MRIAIEGCMHGDLDNVYATLLHLQEVENTKIDLLICCGDFQAVRNEKDLECLNVKPKYRSMNSFWKYYSGEKIAPFPTLFIGGNHEASNYLWELYYGGWAAHNIYFLGFSGVIKFGNVRIGGLSGIFKSHHYFLGHYERPPYNESDIRSIYHVREYDVLKLMQIKKPMDIFLSHDWPLGITDYGNWRELVQRKRFLKEEIETKTLGSKPAAELLEKLKPSYWFSAHLHCKFAALVEHGEGGPVTKFLALDKCLPGRKFLQVVEIESDPGPHEFQYDEEWLAITRKFHSAFPLSNRRVDLRDITLDLQDCQHWVNNKLLNRGGTKPFDFVPTAPCHNSPKFASESNSNECYRNPQTEAFLQLLELPYILDKQQASREHSGRPANSSEGVGSYNYHDEDIPIDDVDEMEELAEAEEDAGDKEETN